MRNEKHTALAVCEFCSLIWGLGLVAGTVYLTGWCSWHWSTWIGCVFLLGIWTCKFCPGHAKYKKETER